MIPNFFLLDTNGSGTAGAYAAVAASRAGAEVMLVATNEQVAEQSRGVIGDDAEIITLSEIDRDELKTRITEMDRVWIFGDEAPEWFVHLCQNEIGVLLVWQSDDREEVIRGRADMVISKVSSEEELLSSARAATDEGASVAVLTAGSHGLVFDQLSNDALPFDLHGAYPDGAIETLSGFFLTIYLQSENLHQAVRQAHFAAVKKLEYDGPLRESGEVLARELSERDKQ